MRKCKTRGANRRITSYNHCCRCILKIFTVEWAQTAAGDVLASIPVVIFGFTVQRYLVRGLLLGSVKG